MNPNFRLGFEGIVSQESQIWSKEYYTIYRSYPHTKDSSKIWNSASHLWPFFRDDVEEIVLAIALDDDLVVAGNGGAARELRPEELGRDFQVDAKCLQAWNLQKKTFFGVVLRILVLIFTLGNLFLCLSSCLKEANLRWT